MADPTSDVDEAICWYCGAPADPACAGEVSLYAEAVENMDGQGYPVVRVRCLDHVHVNVPRCEACRDRHKSVGCLMLLGVWIGCMVGFSLGGWMTVVGFFLGLLMVGFGHYLCDRLSGRKPFLTPYPPIQRLHRAGWKSANN